jgi:hypothetical protein
MMRIILVILVIGFLFDGCHKDPKIGNASALDTVQFCTCIMDGQVWAPDKDSLNHCKISTTYHYLTWNPAYSEFRILATRQVNGFNTTLRIQLFGPIYQPGTYNCKNADIGYMYLDGTGNNWQNSGDTSYSITITHCDQANRIMAGKFRFLGKQVSGFPTKDINVTEGSFNVRWK